MLQFSLLLGVDPHDLPVEKEGKPLSVLEREQMGNKARQGIDAYAHM